MYWVVTPVVSFGRRQVEAVFRPALKTIATFTMTDFELMQCGLGRAPVRTNRPAHNSLELETPQQSSRSAAGLLLPTADASTTLVLVLIKLFVPSAITRASRLRLSWHRLRRCIVGLAFSTNSVGTR